MLQDPNAGNAAVVELKDDPALGRRASASNSTSPKLTGNLKIVIKIVVIKIVVLAVVKQ